MPPFGDGSREAGAERQDDVSARRMAQQEINLRRVNEAIERGRRDEESAAFVCECGRVGCNTTISLALDEYRAVRTSFERFLVAPGHAATPVDRVVEEHDGFAVVTKPGAAATLVADAGPERGKG